MTLFRTIGLIAVCWLTAVNFTFGAPNTDFPSDSLGEVVEQLRPAVSTDCPCRIRYAAGWAGWTGPICDASAGEGYVRAYLESADELPFALVRVGYFDGFFVASCHIVNDFFTVDEVEDMTEEQGVSCFADLDWLAVSLGLPQGCRIIE